MEVDNVVREDMSAVSVWVRLFSKPTTPSIIFIIALFLYFSIVAKGFLTSQNIEAIIMQSSIIGIMAIGLNQVILAGEIDISTGSVLAVCCYAFGLVTNASGSALVGAVAAVIFGGICGILNGVLVALVKIPSFIVTLATMNVLRGLVLVYFGDGALGVLPGQRGLGMSGFLGINISSYILLIVFLIFLYLSEHTEWGRNVYAIGGNMRAARLAGLPINSTLIRTFVYLGLCCGLAGVVLFSQIGQVQAIVGTNYELKVIAAVAIGGTSMDGGRGSAFAPLIGSILLGIILNGMSIMAVPGTFEIFMFGLVILLAVTVDAVRHKVVNRHYE
ncbi:MAG TPA: ABC transporter permease [Anaerovoracaceae bacterium]|nr:ABC transporter permease [Anaerovoracaceae bacterium]